MYVCIVCIVCTVCMYDMYESTVAHNDRVCVTVQYMHSLNASPSHTILYSTVVIKLISFVVILILNAFSL